VAKAAAPLPTARMEGATTLAAMAVLLCVEEKETKSSPASCTAHDIVLPLRVTKSWATN
jgi:hypothetical protein